MNEKRIDWPCFVFVAISLFLMVVGFAASAEAQPGLASAAAEQSARALSQLADHLRESDQSDSRLDGLQWAQIPLTAADSVKAKQLLYEHRIQQLRQSRETEVESRVIRIGDKSMKFDVRRYGDKPADGRSLFISMHGGGGAPARINDQQWENQKRLYRPKEGVYVSPRAPTDTWDLWHQEHIDELFDRLIEDMVIVEGVNWDRVYLMGYSAGGDGVYQLAPRMADRWAAAAMMAGHPNGASAKGLRNVPFALQVGGKDTAYKRNQHAERWKTQLKDLKAQDSSGYEHFVQIYPQLGHWMNRRDAVAVPWMAKFTRDPLPRKLVWVQTGRPRPSHHWLSVDDVTGQANQVITAQCTDQTIALEGLSGLRIRVKLDDRMLDLDLPIQISCNGKRVATKPVKRTIAALAETLAQRGDPNYSFPVEVEVQLP